MAEHILYDRIPVHRSRAALDAAECACALREEMGETPHVDFDFIDPRTGHLEHDPFSCPWCELRARASAYRAATRAPVIARGHRDNRRIGNPDKREARLSVACACYYDNNIRARMNELGEILPAPATARERIDLAAEIEAAWLDLETWDLRRQTERQCRYELFKLGLAYT